VRPKSAKNRSPCKEEEKEDPENKSEMIVPFSNNRFQGQFEQVKKDIYKKTLE
jgi:hypothetical protein